MGLTDKDEAGEEENIVEVHIRHNTDAMAKLMLEIKGLIGRNPNTARLITIDATQGAINVVPQVEATMEKKTTIYRLEKGNVYVIKDEKPDRGFETFSDIIRSQCFDCEKADAFGCEALDCQHCTINCPCTICDLNRPEGLVITRRFPKKVAQQYLIQTTPMIWLTQMRRSDVEILNPNEISRMNSTITSFVEKSKNGVVLFEGLEYLITQNNFDIILKFIQHLHDIIVPSKSCIIFLLDPLALEGEEVHMLLRNMKEV